MKFFKPHDISLSAAVTYFIRLEVFKNCLWMLQKESPEIVYDGGRLIRLAPTGGSLCEVGQVWQGTHFSVRFYREKNH